MKPILKANWKNKCAICNLVPTVQIIMGTKIEETTQCGAHFFGDADCIEPETWESLEEPK